MNKSEKNKKFAPIPDELNRIGKEIVDAAFKVHREFGPGLLEKVYEACFCHELSKKGIRSVRQIDVPIKI